MKNTEIEQELVFALKRALATIAVLKTYCDNALTVMCSAETETLIENTIIRAARRRN